MRSAILIFLLACHAPATGVFVTVSRPSTVSADQLTVSGTFDNTAAFAPGALPEPPRPLTDPEETFTLLLNASDGGKTLRLRIDATLSGEVVASTTGDVAIVRDKIVLLTLTLGAPAICGDGQFSPSLEQCDDGNTRSGDGCSATCTIESGFACTSAPGAVSVCAANCGSGGPCLAGQACSNGACVCNPTSCASGCCQGDTCLPGTDTAACGNAGSGCIDCPSGQTCAAGACSGCLSSCAGCCNGSSCVAAPSFPTCNDSMACVTCNTTTSNRCATDGSCGCGNNPACAAGETCTGGNCQCDPSTCAGCCSGNKCLTFSQMSQTACAIGGRVCGICLPSKPCCDQGVCSKASACP